MNEFLTLQSHPEPIGLDVIDYDLGEFDRFDLRKGVRIKELPVSFSMTVSGKPANLILNQLSLHIASKKFADLLCDAVGDQLQLIPAPLFDERSNPVPNYFLLNCLKLIPCMEWERSTYSRDAQFNQLFVADLRIDRNKVPKEVSILRVAEWPHYIVCRDRLYHQLKGKGLSDLRMVGT